MKSKLKSVVMTLLFLINMQSGRSQGFINLDFEQPILPLNPVNGLVSASSAIPGWTENANGTPPGEILYNSVSLGAAAVSLQGPGSGYGAYHGSYSVILQSSYPGGAANAAISQTAQIPANANSIIFYAYNVNLSVMFAGQTIPTYDLGNAAGSPPYPVYDEFVGNISEFAGHTGTLEFASVNSGGNLDFIQFSTSAVPEPGRLALLASGAILLGLRRRRKA
jgi:hypothetical protein